MPDLMRTHLTSRMRSGLLSEVERNPERLAVLAETTRAALDAVSEDDRRRGLPVPPVTGTSRDDRPGTPRDLTVTGKTTPRETKGSGETSRALNRVPAEVYQ